MTKKKKNVNEAPEHQHLRRADRPKPILRGDRLYEGDNGRVFCGGSVRCAGMTALYTGHCISGQKVRMLTLADHRAWEQEFDDHPQCEVCGIYDGRITKGIERILGPDEGGGVDWENRRTTFPCGHPKNGDDVCANGCATEGE